MKKLNRAQSGRLETTLWLLNRSVFDLQRILELSEIDEPMFHSRSALTPERKAVLRERIADVRGRIAGLARDYVLERREENPLTRVASQLHAHWAGIEDSKSKMLSKYGEIPAGLKETLDPELDRLNEGVSRLLAELKPAP